MNNTGKRLATFNPFSISYTEQLGITGGKCVVSCSGWTRFADGSTEYDLLYDTDGRLETGCVSDSGTSPYNKGDIVHVYP